MEDDQVQDEQQSFQALKSKWAQQAKQEQTQIPTQVVSPPPIPPKPTAVLSQKAHVEEDEEQTSTADDAAKKVSLITQQFEKQKLDVTSGNFSNASSRASSPPLSLQPPAVAPVLTTTPKPILRKAPPPPPPTEFQPSIVHSPPSFDNDPFTHDVQDDESSDGDSDIEDAEEADQVDTLPHENSSSSGDGDNNLIEQVHKAHLKYTKLEEPRFIGAPGVRSHDLPSAAENNQRRDLSSPVAPARASTKKPPPPPPPSKKYHSSARGTIAPTTAAPPTAAPIVQHPPAPPAVASIPMRPRQNIPLNDSTVISPPILPPRPLGGSPLMPQLPPRPSQSTLARAHTIASGSHAPHLKSMSPSSTYSDPPSSFSDYDEEDNRNGLKRANTVSTNKRAMSRSELLMTSSIYPDFSKATRNAPSIILEKPFSTGHKASLSALAASRNLIITGSGLLRTWDAQTGSVISTVIMDANNNTPQNNGESNDRIRAIAIAPCRIPVDEGRFVWVARQDTMLAVVDVRVGGHKVLSKRNDVHMAPILFLLRYGNSEIWSIDDGGVLNVWDVVSADYHSQQNPLLTAMPRRYHVTSHAVAAVIYGSKLWMSSGRTLSAHAIPIAGSQVGSNDTKSQPPIRIPNDMGNITKLMTIPYHPYRIFASHDDGKISMWDANTMERLQVITVSMYGICTMASVGEYYVWAGYNTGMIYVYDTRPDKWVVLKMWKAHTGAVTQLVVDESSLLLDEHRGRLQVVSSDSNGFVGVWDGLLTEHWKGNLEGFLYNIIVTNCFFS